MKVLFFSPYSGIRLHSIQENVLAKSLSQNKIDIAYVTCGGIFKEYCNVMSAHGIKSDASIEIKEKICTKCIHDAKKIISINKAQSFILSDYIDKNDLTRVNEIANSIHQDNFLQFKFKNVYIGKISLYEVLLHFKKMSLQLNDSEWKEYLINFKNTLLSLIAFEKIHHSYNPDNVIIYSPQYAVNGAAAEYAINNNSKVYFVEGSSSNAERYEAIRLWDWKEYGLTNPAVSFWDEKKSFINQSMIDRAIKHFDTLLNASSHAVYSQAKSKNFNLRQYYQIAEEKIIVMAALSSYDEAFAAHAIGKFPDIKVKCPYFEDQFEWIKNTIEFFSLRDNICLIIRMHPRDFPNKRENMTSEQANIWIDLFKKLPKNVIINYPNEQISLYNMLPSVSVLLTGWSATAIEAMLHKIPVVTYYKHLPSYPADIQYTGLSIDEYHSNINKALNESINQKHVINALKWMAFNFSMGSIKTGKPISSILWKKGLKSFMLKVLNKIFPDLLFKLDLTFLKCDINDEKLFIKILTNKKNSIFEYYNENAISKEKDLNKYLDLLAYKYFKILGIEE